MSEEKHSEEKKCLCQNKYFKKFLVVVFGSFIGVYFALSLFAFVNRPCPFYNPYAFAPMPMYQQMHNCPCKHFKDKMKHHKEFKKEIPDNAEDKD